MKTTPPSSAPARLRFPGLLVSLLIGATCPSNGAVVDAFLANPQQISTDLSGQRVWSDVELEESIFHVRRMSLNGGKQSLAVANGAFSYELFPEPAGSNRQHTGYFSLHYGTSEPLDLLGLGFTALRISFSEYDVGPPNYVRLVLSSASRGGSVDLSQYLPASIERETSVEIPLAAFSSVDLSAVTELEFYAYRLPWPAEIRISRIEIVPEPGASGMLAASGALLMLRRRRVVS